MVVILILFGLLLQVWFMIMTFGILQTTGIADFHRNNSDEEDKKIFFRMLFWPVTWVQLLFKICKELLKGFLSIIGDW